MIQGAFDSNDNALGHPLLRAELDKGFDVVLVSSFFCSEAGYYLAKRSDAALALYFTGQVSLSFMDWAVGQPHNPAYLPFLMFDVPAPFTFMQRVVNTLITYVFQMARYYSYK